MGACDGSLKGLRVLGLGCNAGWWSLKAIEAGCDFVAGIDLVRQFGYEVVPLPLNMTNFRGSMDYLVGERLAFLCARHTDLTGLRSGSGDSALPRLGIATRVSLRMARAAVSALSLNARRARLVLGRGGRA